jgi:uncharacterized protein
MLVADVRKGVVVPRYVPTIGPDAVPMLARASELIDLYWEHAGRRRGDLNDALSLRSGGRPDFKVDRGLAKLLADRTTFRGLSNADATVLRKRVFEAAAIARQAGTFDREAILEAVGDEVGSSAQEVAESLYGDLKANEIVEAVESIEPEELLERYNLALAQAVLLRALTLEVTVTNAEPPRLRQLLRHVKFHGLLQEAKREGDVVSLKLDGPLSIFSATPRYGVRMAGFLPALLLCREWKLEARVQFGRGRRKRDFSLTPELGLKSRRRDVGAWLPELIEAFSARFVEVAPEWRVDREVPLLNLAGEVLVPDFRFVHESGWQGWMEVLGYWRRGAVAKRLKVLRETDAPRLVLAVDQSLKLGKQSTKGLKGPVVSFRDVPNAKKVFKALEALRLESV